MSRQPLGTWLALGVALPLMAVLPGGATADEPVVVQAPDSHLAIAVASEGHTDQGLPTAFTVYGFPHDQDVHVSLADRGELPAEASFEDLGDGSGRFGWPSPEVGVYHMTFEATDGAGTVRKDFTLEVGDYGYPPENAGPMIEPAFPPPPAAAVLHAAADGTAAADGSEQAPTTVIEATRRARELIAPDRPVYVLLRAGDRWEGMADFAMSADTRGYPDAPIVFAPYGTGEPPYVARLFCQANVEYLHFQDLQLHDVIFFGNKYHGVEGDNYPGTEVQRLHLDERLTVQRLRFYRCSVDAGGALRFFNGYANAGQGSRVPEPNSWWGGGPLAGMMRDIEISHCTFDGAGHDDAINFNGPDRGIWVHHNTFRDSKEEHLDIAGGTGHVVEHNLCVGSRTNNGIKLHSQFSLVTDTRIEANTILYAGGWNDEVVGGRGNALVGQNVMGCRFAGNNLISRWSAAFADSDRQGYQAQYGTFAGNVIEGNVFGGGVQITGVTHQLLDQVAFRNVFRANVYCTWGDDSALIRFWSDPMRIIRPEQFGEWQALPGSDEHMGDLSALFVDPFLPDDPNAPLDLQNPGDWRRR